MTGLVFLAVFTALTSSGEFIALMMLSVIPNSSGVTAGKIDFELNKPVILCMFVNRTDFIILFFLYSTKTKIIYQ